MQASCPMTDAHAASERTDVIATRWIRVRRCPACREKEICFVGKLQGGQYIYQQVRIPFPDEGVSLVACVQCGLVYKTAVLAPEALARVCKELEGRVWTAGYGFAEEVKLITETLGTVRFDLLDIGAAGGWLLKATARFPGRRSAMDVARENGVDSYLRGEFIQAALDDDDLVWSGEPYDVVTLFDVAEHFYDGAKAFSRLLSLVKPGGIVIVETGDVASLCPASQGVARWWYAQRFPHHIFWSAESLKNIADRYGFETIRSERKRNKNVTQLSMSQQARALVKSHFYRVAPTLYRRLLERLGKTAAPPCDPRSKDHIRVVLRAAIT